MSYILEALKKADRERMVGHVPDLEAVHDVSPPSRRRHRWLWLLGALLVLNGLLITGLMLRDDADDEVAYQADGVVASAPTPAPERAVAPPESGPLTVPAPLRRPPWKVSYYQPPAREPEPAALLSAEKGPAAAPQAATGGGSVVYMDAPLTGESPATKASEAVPAESPPVIGATGRSEPAREPGDSVLPDWDDLPLEFRSGFEVPRIDVHVYDTDPRQRFILVNLIKYRPGDRLESGALLEQITPEGVQLLYRGKRFIYRQ